MIFQIQFSCQNLELVSKNDDPLFGTMFAKESIQPLSSIEPLLAVHVNSFRDAESGQKTQIDVKCDSPTFRVLPSTVQSLFLTMTVFQSAYGMFEASKSATGSSKYHQDISCDSSESEKEKWIGNIVELSERNLPNNVQEHAVSVTTPNPPASTDENPNTSLLHQEFLKIHVSNIQVWVLDQPLSVLRDQSYSTTFRCLLLQCLSVNLNGSKKVFQMVSFTFILVF